MVKKPIILCIMDGYGLSSHREGNAIMAAKKPNLDRFFEKYPSTYLEASGEAVGLPEGQMGNSEVGHLNIGAGRIVYQSLTLINKAVREKTFFENEHYLAAIENVKKKGSNLHIFGLMSNGGVHSHIDHIIAMIEMAHKESLKDVFVHAFMDGRDVDPQVGVTFLDQIQTKMDELHFGHIASIHGRYYAMDRDKNMDRVDISYRVLTERVGRSFTSYRDYLKEQYKELPTTGKDPSDEFIIPAYNENVNAPIKDGDSIVFMNYRPDRAIQISTVFTNPLFYQNPPIKEDGSFAFKPYTPRVQLKDIFFVCTMKYADSVKGRIAFALPKIDMTLGQFLAENGYHQLRIAETEKYAHVTFFFDGTVNFDGVEKPELTNCRRVLVNSPKVATYDLKPEMSAYEVTDKLMVELNKGDLDVVILNFANCDMVGHTAVIPSVIKAVEAVDTCVGRIIDWVEAHDAVLLLTADHGNAEQCLDEKGNPFTAHTTNLVPFGISLKGIKLRPGKLSNIAPTILDLLGAKKPLSMDEDTLIEHN